MQLKGTGLYLHQENYCFYARYDKENNKKIENMKRGKRKNSERVNIIIGVAHGFSEAVLGVVLSLRPAMVTVKISLVILYIFLFIVFIYCKHIYGQATPDIPSVSQITDHISGVTGSSLRYPFL